MDNESPTFSLNGWTSIEDILRAHGDSLRLDLGCGYYKPSGYIGLDNLSGVGIQLQNAANAPDVIVDIDQHGIPFPDESCDCVRASHFLEHTSLNPILQEAHRVLKPDGDLDLILPYANSAEGMYPGHTLFFTERWFEESPFFQSLFKITDVTYYESEAWRRLPRIVRRVIPFSFARTFLFNACWQMRLEARAIKPQAV